MRSESGLLARAWERRRRPAELVRDALSAKAAPKIIIGLALLLTSSSLTIGFSVDEYVQRIAARTHTNLPALERAPWDLYTFAPGREGDRALMEQGVLPWWTDQELLISFLRPLSSLTMWIDQTHWPESG